jgi:hypothetical protein
MKNSAIQRFVSAVLGILLVIFVVNKLNIYLFQKDKKTVSFSKIIVKTNRIPAQDCLKKMDVNFISSNQLNILTIGTDVKFEIDYVNEKSKVMSSAVWEESFSEAELGQVKIDPLLFPSNSKVFRYSDQSILVIFWIGQDKKPIKGRVWMHDEDFSYSFKLVEPVEIDPNEMICWIKHITFDVLSDHQLD